MDTVRVPFVVICNTTECTAERGGRQTTTAQQVREEAERSEKTVLMDARTEWCSDSNATSIIFLPKRMLFRGTVFK